MPCDQLGVIGALYAAVGPIKQRERGFGAGELLAGLAAAQLSPPIARDSATSGVAFHLLDSVGTPESLFAAR